MPSSTARREKLVNRTHLILIGCLFAVAFTVFMPARQAFKLDKTATGETHEVIDDLDLAYLKARASRGDQAPEEMITAATLLIKSGQHSSAKDLLAQLPDSDLNQKQRYLLDLELAASDYEVANSAVYSSARTYTRAGKKINTDKSDESDLVAKRDTAALQLFNVLHLQLDTPELHDAEILGRATSLSKYLDRNDLTAALYELHAAANEPEAGRIFEECGDYFARLSVPANSANCYTNALYKSNSHFDSGSLQIKILRQQAALSNPVATEELIDNLKNENSLSLLQLENLAALFLEIGRPRDAYPVYAKLAVKDSAGREDWLYSAAQWAEASSRPGVAAEYLITVQQELKSSTSSEDKLDLEMKIRQLLVAAGENGELLRRVELALNNNPDDLESLESGTLLAQQLGKHELAASWNSRVLALDPTNKTAINRQIDLALASRDLKSAVIWSQKLVELEPSNLDAREKLARVTEWSGDPVAAQQHWSWLAKNSKNANSLAELERLSAMNFSTSEAADALRSLTRVSRPTSEQVQKLVSYYELDGRPPQAAEALEEIMSRYGETPFNLQELARLHYRHVAYTDSLAAWDRYSQNYPATTESTLARVELNWRLKEHDRSAAIADELNLSSSLSEASEFQIRLLSEISWRYRKHDLAMAIKSAVDELGDESVIASQGNRIIESMKNQGEPALAAAQAETYWRKTGDNSLALKAMSLALESDELMISDNLLSENDSNKELREIPQYWSLAAATHLRNGDLAAAQQSYDKALVLDPDNVSAISGLMWLHVGESDTDALVGLLEKHNALALEQSELWSVFAIASLQTGDAEQSVQWFNRMIDTIDADYGLLLTFADALESSGRAEHAYRVRTFAVTRLRPLLVKAVAEEVSAEQDELLRQYASLANKFGSAEHNEKWSEYFLTEPYSNQTTMGEKSSDGEFWKQDMAIAWLMSTERHDHARAIMARLHDQRSRDPVWQQFSLALAEKDRDAIRAILDSGIKLSMGNRIVALNEVGEERQAYALAVKTLKESSLAADRQIAESQYLALRGLRPSYTSGNVRRLETGDLNTDTTGFTIRHSFANSDLGLQLDVSNEILSSDVYMLNGRARRTGLEVSLFAGNSLQGGYLTSGFKAAEDEDIAYSRGRYFLKSASRKSMMFAEFGYNEPATQSPLLRIDGKQNRLSAGFETEMGRREFLKFNLDANELSSRVEEKRIARGLQARTEVGLRDSFGSNFWSASLAATHSQYDVESTVPAELLLTSLTAVGAVVAEESSGLFLGATLSRGGPGGEFPQATSPRYFLSGNVGHTWPEKKTGFQLQAGAGIRILGGDELSLAFQHDSTPDDLTKGNSSSFGVNYRYHFRH